jgi:NADH:ubiquinone reductase (non-electrogenic)
VDNPLPPLAQVAEQQGRYLARRLNEEITGPATPRGATVAVAGAGGAGGGDPDAFVYRHLGSMATIGGLSAILQLELPKTAAGGGGAKDASSSSSSSLDAWLPRRLRFRGFFSWVAWRSAYATRLGSIRKRASVLFDWTQTMLFGRDLSQW